MTIVLHMQLTRALQSGIIRQLAYEWLEGRSPGDESDRIFQVNSKPYNKKVYNKK